MFECEICGKAFDAESSLRGHKSAAHPLKKKRETKQKQETTKKVTLSAEEQSIADIVAAESDEWRKPIREDELNDFSLMRNVLDLPPEAARLQNEKKFAFRWCERTRDRIDQLTRSVERPEKWFSVNSTRPPGLAHLVDPMLGGICRLDQILLFKPWGHHAIVQGAKAELADVAGKSGTLGSKSFELSGDGVHAQASVRGMDEEATGLEVGGMDVVMAEESAAADLSDLVVNE